MPLTDALLLLVAVVALAVLCERRSLHPFGVGVVVTVGFGFAAGMSMSLLGKAFGVGFSGSVANSGLVIVAAAAMSEILNAVGLPAWLAGSRFSGWLGSKLSTVIGVVVGLGSTPTAAFAGVLPLLRLTPAAGRPRRAVALALGLSASHGLLLPSPVAIAAMAILAADWHKVVAFGVPLTLISAVLGYAVARRTPVSESADPTILIPPTDNAGRGLVAVVVAALVLTAMLIVQSLGDIPSEPFGGGPAREMLVGLGRPLMLLLAGVAIVFTLTLPRRALSPNWMTSALTQAAPLIMVTALGGALQKLAQETGMAELVGEHVLGWHLSAPFGLLVPFAAAVVVKSLQGSSLVAAITAAGMAGPLLASLGLESDTGRTLAVLAVGAGSMTVSHINDDFFWLVGGSVGLRPLATLRRLSGGTAVQGAVSLLALLALAAAFL